MTRSTPETRLQFVVVKYLRLVLPADAVLWMVPNGGRMSEAARMKRSGMGEEPGVSDLMFLWAGRLHCLELKVRKNPQYGIKRTTYQQKPQKAFQSAVEAAGGVYAVVRDLGDLRAALVAWGVPASDVEVQRALAGAADELEHA